MPRRFTVQPADAYQPRSVAEADKRTIPVTSLVPGHHVFVKLPGVIHGFTLVRSVKRHGSAFTVKTDYGDAHIGPGQGTVVILGDAS